MARVHLSNVFSRLERKFPVFFEKIRSNKQLFIPLFLLIALPVVIGAALTVQNLRQKAAEQNVVRFVDANGTAITETSTSNVSLMITLPQDWVLASTSSRHSGKPIGTSRIRSWTSQDDGKSLVPKVYAQSASDLTCGNVDFSPESAQVGSKVSITVNGGSTTGFPMAWIRVSVIAPGQSPTNIGSVSCGGTNNSCGGLVNWDTTGWNPGSYTVALNLIDTNGTERNPDGKDSGCNIGYSLTASSSQTQTPTTAQTEPSATQFPDQQPSIYPTHTQQDSQQHILKSITIDNKDTDGSSGGDQTRVITSNFLDILTKPVAWKLNMLTDPKTSATRTVQVTLSDGTTTVPYTIQITLKPKFSGTTLQGLPQDTGSVTHIASCQEVTESGNYVLDQDLADGEDKTDTCFSIHDVSDIMIDCNNHSIFSSKVSTRPIDLVNVNNFTIKNCKISAGNSGASQDKVTGDIYIDNSNDGIISNNTIENYQIWTSNTRNVQFKNNTVIGGIYMYFQRQGYNSIIDGNNFSSDKKDNIAIWVSEGSGNTITNNVINGNSDGVLKHEVGGDDGIVLGSENEAGGITGEKYDLVQNNVISNEMDTGIETVGLVQHATISDNKVTNTGVAGIGGWYASSLSNNTITNNYIDNSPSLLNFFYDFRGDYKQQTNVQFRDNTFTKNTLVNIKSDPELSFSDQPYPILIDLTQLGINIDQSNNTFSNNDLGHVGFPYLEVTSAMVDKGGNTCTNGQYPNFPLKCLGSPTILKSVKTQDLTNKINLVKKTIISFTDRGSKFTTMKSAQPFPILPTGVAPDTIYNLIKQCFGLKVANNPSCKDADLNGDGVVNGEDYNLYLRSHPTTSP